MKTTHSMKSSRADLRFFLFLPVLPLVRATPDTRDDLLFYGGLFVILVAIVLISYYLKNRRRKKEYITDDAVLPASESEIGEKEEKPVE
jgi:hypothetical protein